MVLHRCRCSSLAPTPPISPASGVFIFSNQVFAHGIVQASPLNLSGPRLADAG
jgi:hypothetical protein